MKFIANRICENCNKEYVTREKKSRFCGLPCAYQKTNIEKGEKKRREYEKVRKEYYDSPKRCLRCDAAIKYEAKDENKYCSHSCAASITNSTRRTTVEKNCENCNKIFSGLSSKIFCGKVCQLDNREKVNIEKTLCNFETGKISRNPTIKRCLIHLYGEFCFECGQLPMHNKKKLVLQVDHEDGDSDNNMPENVRLLCPNCHTQTKTFCNGNKESKRNKYRQMWREKQKLLCI